MKEKQIATTECAARLEIFKEMLGSLCRACGVTLNLIDLSPDLIAVRDARNAADVNWPAVASFTGTDAAFGVMDFALQYRPLDEEQ